MSFVKEILIGCLLLLLLQRVWELEGAKFLFVMQDHTNARACKTISAISYRRQTVKKFYGLLTTIFEMVMWKLETLNEKIKGEKRRKLLNPIHAVVSCNVSAPSCGKDDLLTPSAFSLMRYPVANITYSTLQHPSRSFYLFLIYKIPLFYYHFAP